MQVAVGPRIEHSRVEGSLTPGGGEPDSLGEVPVTDGLEREDAIGVVGRQTRKMSVGGREPERS